MNNPIYPTDLTDRQWACIKALIPPTRPGGRPRPVDRRPVLNALLYVAVTGCQWRRLPRDYPKWPTVSPDFRRWRDDGTWWRLHDTLRARVRRQAGRHKQPTAGGLDSPSVKTSQGPGGRGDDQGQQVNGRKRHLVVDTLGLLLAVVVPAASASDAAGARRLFRRLGGAGKKLRRLWVDGAYRGRWLAWGATHCRFGLEPVRRAEGERGFRVLPKRWIGERTFA